MTTPTPTAKLLAKIDTLPAGPELDAAIARHVFGFPYVFVSAGVAFATPPSGTLNDPTVRLPAYSTVVVDAWRVVEKMEEVGAYFQIHSPVLPPPAKYRKWSAAFGGWWQSADTAPLAICMASLRFTFRDAILAALSR